MDGQSPGHDPKLGHGITRRKFLRDTAVATGGAVAVGAAVRASVAAQATPPVAASPGAGGAAVATGGYTPVALSPEEYTTLRAILARLIPADELGPGAVEAGVDVFIDRSLSAAYAQSLPDYTQNLEALNAEALKQGGVFAALSTDQQDALLKRLEATTGGTPNVETASHGATGAGGITGASAAFFPTLLSHTRQGMFGDPMYGGNINFAGWDLIGYPGVKRVWTAEEQAIGTVVPFSHVSDAKFGGEPVR